MSFSITEGGAAPAINATRLRRQLVEQAIDAATAAEWETAAEINKRILELGPDSEAENRMARAYWEMGELSKAREHYQSALALDPTNRIAERNIGRLRMLMAEAGKKTVPAQKGSKAPVSIFVEETGKTGFAHLVDLVDPKLLAQVNPGDAVELAPEGPRLEAKSNGAHIGYVEPRVAARLLKLIAEGNKYAAGVTSIGERDVRIIVRETYQDPANYGKVSFPTAAKVSDMRPYTKGTLIREEMDLEDELEFDEEDDEIEDIGRVIPDDLTSDEAFVEEEPVEASDDDEDA
jgi:tetratricopeptide (TPR) repeat protein